MQFVPLRRVGNSDRAEYTYLIARWQALRLIRKRTYLAGNHPARYNLPKVKHLSLLKTPNACDSRALEKSLGLHRLAGRRIRRLNRHTLERERLERADYPLYSQTAFTLGRRSDR